MRSFELVTAGVRGAASAALVALAGCGAGGGRSCDPAANASCIRVERIRDDVAYLASPELAGRRAGTAGNELALARVEALFRGLGLEPAGDAGGFRQAFDVDAYVSSGRPTLSLAGASLELGTEFVPIDFSGSGEVSAPVIFAGYGLTVPRFDPSAHPRCTLPSAGYDDYGDVDVRGRVALVLRHAPNDDLTVADECPAEPGLCAAPPCHVSAGQKIANAARRGARAVLFVQDDRHPGGAIRDFSAGLVSYAAQPTLPVAIVSRARADAALPELALRAARIDADLRPASVATGTVASLSVAGAAERRRTANVLAVLPGSHPDLAREVVVVGAHVDHLGTDPYTGVTYPGADDNASGTAVLLELARALAGGRGRTQRTVLFAAWNAEEAGLVGSCAYVAAPAFPLARTAVALSLDQLGAGDGSGLALFGATEPANAWLVPLANGAAAARGLEARAVAEAPLLASDHACFARAGVPAVLAQSRGSHPNTHRPEDTAAAIDGAALAASARLLWVTLQALAAGASAGP